MASSSIVSELVWHFAGYLRLPPGDNFTVKILYEGAAEGRFGPDGEGAVAHPHHIPVTDGLAGARLGVPIPAFGPPQLMHAPHPQQFHDPHHNTHAPFIGLHSLPPLPGPVPRGRWWWQ
jgi:hypothetical protein